MSRDANGYAPSIIEKTSGIECHRCGITGVDLVRHEPLRGAFRQKSKKLGLWITLCPRCHELIHSQSKKQIKYKQEAQLAAQFYYDWTIEDFIKEFGKNYL